MSQHHVIDFLPDLTATPNGRGDVWGEAGRAVEAGYRAPSPIGLPLRFLFVISLGLLPLLQRLAEAFLILVRPWSN
jgi:hypothetical protein